MEHEEMCDKVLTYISGLRDKAAPIDSIYKSVQGLTPNEVANTVRMLTSSQEPKLLRYRNYGDWVELTLEGIEHLSLGGYSGKQWTATIEKSQNESDKELARQANRSVVETNKSIVATNDSVQATNISVQSLNSKTETIYKFQKTTTYLTIGVACAAVVVSLIGLFKGEKQLDIQPLLNKQEQMQKQIDQLKDSLITLSFQDTLQKKRL